MTSFETDNGVVHSTPRSPPSSNLATLSENVSLNDEHILETSDASVAFVDSNNSDLPSLMEAGSSHPATLSAAASAVHEESNHWAPDTVIAGTVDFSPLPYSHSCCASQWEAESGANAEVDSTGSVDECLPSLIDDDHEEHERFNPSPMAATTVQGVPSELPVVQAAQQMSSYGYIQENTLSPMTATTEPPVAQAAQQMSGYGYVQENIPSPMAATTIQGVPSELPIAQAAQQMSSYGYIQENTLSTMTATTDPPVAQATQQMSGYGYVQENIPSPMAVTTVQGVPSKPPLAQAAQQMSTCSYGYVQENIPSPLTATTVQGVPSEFPVVQATQQMSSYGYIQENTPSPLTATNVQGVPSEPPVAQAAQQMSSCSCDNDNTDFDSDEDVNEEERIASLFMNFCYNDTKNKKKSKKSTATCTKKNIPLAANEGITVAAEINAFTDVAIDFDCPISLSFANASYTACSPDQQNGLNYNTSQTVPPPLTQTAYVAPPDMAVNMESTYTDSVKPVADETCIAPSMTGETCTAPPMTDKTYTALPTTDKTYTALPMPGETCTALPMTDKTYTALPMIGETYTALPMTDKTYTALPMTDETCTGPEDKPTLFVPDDGDLHVHDYGRRKERPSHRAFTRSTFSFLAFTVSLRSCYC